MREILFRGKRIDNGEWVYGNYAFTDVNGKKYFIFQNKPLEHEVIPETVGQYTGLTDKNGKKIFEGDIIIQFCRGLKKLYKVVFNVGSFTLQGKDTHAEICEVFCYPCEIIGNIHDNPELLNKKENNK